MYLILIKTLMSHRAWKIITMALRPQRPITTMTFWQLMNLGTWCMVSQIHKLPQRHFSENRENIVFMVTYIFRQSCFFEICALCLWWINFILFNSFFNLSVFYIISQSTKCLWNTVAGRLSFLAKSVAGGL